MSHGGCDFLMVWLEGEPSWKKRSFDLKLAVERLPSLRNKQHVGTFSANLPSTSSVLRWLKDDDANEFTLFTLSSVHRSALRGLTNLTWSAYRT